MSTQFDHISLFVAEILASFINVCQYYHYNQSLSVFLEASVKNLKKLLQLNDKLSFKVDS